MTDPITPPVNTPAASPTPQTPQTPVTAPTPTPTPTQATTPPMPRPTPTPVVGKKPVSKLSIKGFIIGCWVLLVLVVGGLTAIFYNLIKNPNQLSSLGLSADTTKTLLQTFAAVFFGLLVFLGIALLVVNLYRIITVKNQSKIKYTFGTIGGLFIFIIAIALGSNVLSIIKNISVENVLDGDKILLPYYQLKEWPSYIRSLSGLKIIAPALMYYQMNANYFNTQILPQIGQATVTDVTLDCGNGQTLKINTEDFKFQGYCLYLKKGTYPLNLLIDYTTIPAGEKLQKNLTWGEMTVDSEITIIPSKGDLAFNDTKTELNIGKVPSKSVFDASKVFEDLRVKDYKVSWDFDGDGVYDKQNEAAPTFVYKEAKLYNVAIRFPLLNDYIYTFPVRVEQSDVPVCEITFTENKEANYSFQTTFLDSNVMISQYQFDIIERVGKGRIIDSVKSTNGQFTYQFPGKGSYAIQANFLTEEGKQGQCESDDLQVGATDFQIAYDLSYKSPDTPEFQTLTNSSDVNINSGVIMIRQLPTIIKLDITQIIPNSANASKKVSLNGKNILSSNGETFELTIDENIDYKIAIVVEDTSRGTKTEEDLQVKIKRDDIIGRVVVKPDTVGTDPFTVKFDASTTTLNDPTDEIVYFSWDFGDGETRKNLSESIITHTYKYDTVKENGTYHPVLTIKTKKGRELAISPSSDIIVKKANKSLTINIDSHPAQLADANDRVSLSLEVSGLPTTIKRDFGNGKTLECAGRECIQATQIYTSPGNYLIRAEVLYDNQPSVEGSISLKVK